MAAVDVTEVRVAELDTELMVAQWLDIDPLGDATGAWAIPLRGSIVGKHAPVALIEVSLDGELLWELPLNELQPEVAAMYPDHPWAGWSGFNHRLNALKLPFEFELSVSAVWPDGQHQYVGLVRGTRKRLNSPPARREPIAITSLGRTGSTLLVALLAQHPDVFAYRPFEFEPKVALYWADLLAALSEPASYRQFLMPDNYGSDWFLGTERRTPLPPATEHRIEDWLVGQYVEELAAMCKARIDSFYDKSADIAGSQARYFVEKMLPGTPGEAIVAELYPGGRQVFLVRDFRDMLASMIAVDRLRGFDGFGRTGDASKEDLIARTRNHAGLLAKSWTRFRDSAILVRYEDLVLEPRRTLEPLLTKLGLEPTPAVVDRMLDESRLADQQRGHGTSPSAAESIGRWKRELDPGLQAICDDAFGDLLDAFGYSR